MTDSLVTASTPTLGVRVLAFNRPTKRNALSQEMICEFVSLLEAASKDETVKTIVITGNSSFFCGEPFPSTTYARPPAAHHGLL